jgi:dipeptidyl aminopeptidase/acylaminoacyl peptidase
MHNKQILADLTKTPVPPIIPNSLSVEALWKVQRISGITLAPDGQRVCASVARYDMQANTGSSCLWIFAAGQKAIELTSNGDPNSSDKDSGAQWSGDGKHIAFVAKRAGDEAAQIYLINPDGGEAKRLTQLSTGVSSISWVGDGKRSNTQLAFISWVWPDLANDQAQAKRLQERKQSKVKAHVVEHGHYRHWDHWLADGRVPQVHVVNIATGRVQNIMFGSDHYLPLGDPDGHCFDISPNGKMLAFVFNPLGKERADTSFKIGLLTIGEAAASRLATATQRKTKQTVRVLNANDLYEYASPKFSGDGAQLACTRAEFGKHFLASKRLAVLDVKTGKCNDWLSAWDREPAGNHQWGFASQDGQLQDSNPCLYFTAEDSGCQHLYRAQAGDTLPTVVAKGGTINEFCINANGLSYAVNSATYPTQIFYIKNVIDLENQPATRIDRLNDALLRKVKLGEVKAHWCKGANGDPVHIWVTYPPGFDPKKKYPLLHSIHGGPHTCFGDTWHARWNTQAFAAHGYVVACVQYHGSTSYGQAFKEAISGQWGLLEAHDIDAGTNYLVKQGYIDKDQVVGTGGSYGGYMVAMLNGKAHRKPKAADPFKAYVCHAGCFDWVSMFGDDAWFWHWRELGAYYYDDMQQVLKQSPHNYAANMNTPTLVLHGELDYRVPVSQGFQYFNTLRARGVESRLVYFPDENHWVLKPQNSRLWFSEFFGWVGQFVKGVGFK